MVLEDVGDGPSDSFSDNPYPSDNDPYSSSSVAPGQRFDASQLPHPMPILGPFMGFSAGAVRYKTETTIKFAEEKVGRSLSAEEAQTLAFHLYRMEQTKSYFTFTGMTFGAKRWYDTMATSRYPLFQPKEVDPNRFLIFRGQMAIYARHSWRFLVYAFVAGQLGGLVGQLIAQPLAARDTAADPKLAQFGADLKAAIRGQPKASNDPHRLEAAKKEQNQDSSRRDGKLEPNDNRSARLPPHAGQPRWRARAPPPTAAQPQDDDDMSPTAGNDPWTPAEGSAFSTEAVDSQRGQQSAQPTQATRYNARQPSRPGEDDMSPTDGFLSDNVESRSKPGDSAWDRLRRGGSPPERRAPPPRREDYPYGNVQRERKEGSTVGDGFTFADSDEERKQAQDKAQREFDARLERERQGKDFEEERKW